MGRTKRERKNSFRELSTNIILVSLRRKNIHKYRDKCMLEQTLPRHPQRSSSHARISVRAEIIPRRRYLHRNAMTFAAGFIMTESAAIGRLSGVPGLACE